MNSDSKLTLSGVIPPMITPLTPDGQIDGEGVDRLVHHLLVNGCGGVFVLGSSGEGPWLSAAQRETLIGRTVQAVAGRVPVLVGALEPSTVRTLEVLPMIEDLGADAVVVASPYYFGADESAQLWHFERVAQASKLPVVLYNIPPTTHNPVAVRTIQQALQFDPIIALKDSAGNMDDFKAFLALREQRPEFRVFQGAEKLSNESLLAGADGLVPGLGNLVPKGFVQLVEAVRAGNEAEARAIQAQIDELWTLHGYDYWLPCLKYAASLCGFGSGATIGHRVHLTDEGRAAIQSLVNAAAPVGD
ncbi:MAG: dihydrodipicolinate synthase family protein [Anaerolineae bacterium]|nr:dihydrodipicolinate synthase family protein [Anaerolineae bacterium]